MAPRRPTAAHVVSLAQPGQPLRQYIARSSLDLARQVKATCPDLPPTLVEQLARLVVERRARVDLPDLLTMRHVSTLTAAPVPATSPAPQAAPTVPGETPAPQATATPLALEAGPDGDAAYPDSDPAHGATI